MHYYKFSITAWGLSTAHLSLVEEAIYFRLVNFYYDTEAPIPLETQSVFRRLRMGNESVMALAILDEFFVKTEKGYVHEHCEELLKEYRKTKKKNKTNGGKGGRPRKDAASRETQEKPSGFSNETQSEPSGNPNHKPITNNQEPETNNQNIKQPSADADLFAGDSSREIAKQAKAASSDVLKIFTHWQSRMNHPSAKLDSKRNRLIQSALKLGYSADDLIFAIDGCAKSPHHMGQNDTGTVYDSIELIFRNADKIDGFIKRNNTFGGPHGPNNQPPRSNVERLVQRARAEANNLDH